MKRRAFLVASVLAFFLSVLPGWGRVIQWLTPDEMVKQADLVCTGTVVSTTKTDERSRIKLFPADNGTPVRITEATIKVLNVNKGNASQEIRVRYPQIDMEQSPGSPEITVINNGPELIYLYPGLRGRFFLKQVPGQTAYVNVADGQTDQLEAVQPLHPGEPESNPPLLEEEARRIALKALKHACPSWVPDLQSAQSSFRYYPGYTNRDIFMPIAADNIFMPAVYTLRVTCSSPPGAEAEIGVWMNRKLASDSWYFPGSYDRTLLVGRRILFETASQTDPFTTCTWAGTVVASDHDRLTVRITEAPKVKFAPWQKPFWKEGETVKIPFADVHKLRFPIVE